MIVPSDLASASWPLPAHPDRVESGLVQWMESIETIKDREARTVASQHSETKSGRAMLECVFGSSPFLARCLCAEPEYLRALWNEGSDACVELVFSELAELAPDTPMGEVRSQLRVARRRIALATALADIAGLWDLETVTGTLSRLADRASSIAIDVLLRQMHERGRLALPEPDRPSVRSGLIALGLGKLGGRELNYSSDIDLILLYDPDILPSTDPQEAQRHLTRLGRNFIALLSERADDGYVFRVDLRLRPDPSATPLVMSTEAAEHYYAARGQTWERAALIKARPVAGDIAAAEDFLNRIKPFIWKRHLDFATVQELHEMKRQIDQHHGTGSIRMLGHNLKLGRGGIREIEFFAQTHQLVWGGQDVRMRTLPTCETLRAMVSTGQLPQEAADDFISCYRFLRRAEHRVQMVADAQTHSLPKDPGEYAAFTRFFGFATEDAFSRVLKDTLLRVENKYSSFFELPAEYLEEATVSSASIDAEQLARLGFAKPQQP